MSKYNNKKTTIDNIVFDSKKEAKRYKELKLLEKVGGITSLTLQPKFLLQDKFKHKGTTYRKIEYIADFSYFERGSEVLVIEDVKGVKTDVFRIKEKLLKFQFEQNNIQVDFRII